MPARRKLRASNQGYIAMSSKPYAILTNVFKQRTDNIHSQRPVHG